MTEQVISIEAIRAKARAAHAAGHGRDEHRMNWHSPALATWQEEWDRCEAAKGTTATEKTDWEILDAERKYPHFTSADLAAFQGFDSGRPVSFMMEPPPCAMVAITEKRGANEA